MKDLYICEKVHRDYVAIAEYIKPEPDHLNTMRLPPSGAKLVTMTYDGPLSAWKGKTALVRELVAAQFDDRGHYMAYGWHLFNASDFKPKPTQQLYVAFARAVAARARCLATLNNGLPPNAQLRLRFVEWNDAITGACKDHLPSGSGFDNGTTIDLDSCKENKLVFNTAFHHMDEHGGYDGWTEHQVIVTASLEWGFDLRVTGPNRNDIKDLILSEFSYALEKAVPLL